MEKLQKIKEKHETWVREALLYRQGDIALKNDTFLVYRYETGKSLISSLMGSHASVFDNDELHDKDEVNLVGDFFQSVQDYIDLWDGLDIKDQLQAQFELDDQIQLLKSHDFLVYGCQKKSKYVWKNGPADDWRIAYLLAFRKSNPLTAKRSENVEILTGVRDTSTDQFASYIVVKHQ